MVHDLSQVNTLLNEFIAEIRDAAVQKDSMRFRRNMERIGEIMAVEISREMPWTEKEITTPLGVSKCTVLEEQPVLATILRAGLAMHTGLLNYFDKADNAFVSAYRKHHKDGNFEIKLEYLSSPNLENRILIVSDPMVATGSSMALTLKELHAEGKPKHTHVATAIACADGIEYILKNVSNVTIWAAAIDEELTARAYIVPGLGDAGDLAYGNKVQD